MMKMVKIEDFLTVTQMRACIRIYEADGDAAVDRICEEVIRPNLKEINEKLGQENEPKYLAYACLYALRQAGRQVRGCGVA